MTQQEVPLARDGADAGPDPVPPTPLRIATAGDDLVPFLGRDAEVHAVQRVLTDVTETGARVVAVHGAPGTGKTTVLETAARAARRMGFEVLSARAGKGDDGSSPGLLHRLLPHLVPAVRPCPPDRQDAARVLGNERPVLLAVDDVHHADTASVRWLASVPWLLAGHAIAVLVTVCNGEPVADPVAMDELVAACAARVRLGSLTPAVMADLVLAVLGTPPDEEFLRCVTSLTGGNPQLLRTVLDLLTDVGSAPTREGLVALADLDLSPAVAVIQARLRRAAPEALTLARTLTALGEGARLDQVAGVSGVELSRLAEAARALVRMGVLAESDGVFSFAQLIVPAALRHELSFAALQTMHLQAARLLHESGAADEDVVSHLLRTSDVGEAWVVDRLRSCARAALTARRPDDATAQLRRALAEPMPDDQRADLLRLLAEALAPTDVPAATARLDEALGLTTAPAVRLATGLALAQLMVLCDRRAAGIAVLADLARELPAGLAAEAEAVRLALALPECGLQGWSGLPERGRAERGLPGDGDVPVTDGDTSTLRRRLAAVSAVRHCWAGDDLEAARRDAEEALAMPPTRPDEVAGYLGAAEVLLHTGRADEALRRVERALRAVRSSDHPGCAAVVRITRARICLQLGVLSEATDDAVAVGEVLGECGVSPTSPPAVRARAVLATLLVEQGELDRAGELVQDGDPFGDPAVRLESAELLLARGRHSAALGDHEAAAAEFCTCGRTVEGWGPVNPAVLPWRGLAALSLATLGDHDEAARLAGQEVQLARRWGAPVPIGRALVVQGACSADGDLPALREAVAVLACAGAPLDLARARHALGAALHRRDERTEARDELRLALGLAQQCQAPGLADRVRGDLAAAGARLRRVSQTGPESLTTSERTVAVLASKGRTNREIAESLFLQRRTVEIHLTNAYRKLRITGRDQLPQALN